MRRVKSLINVVRKLTYMLTPKQKRMGIVVVFMILVGSLLEMLGVSAILPFIEVILTPEAVSEKWYVKPFVTMFEIQNKDVLTITIGIVIIFVYIFKNLYLYFSVMFQTIYRSRIQKDLSTKMLRAYMRRPYEYFININTAEVIRGIGVDIVGVYNLMDNLFRFTGEFVTAVLIAVFIVLTDAFMALSIIAMAGLCFAIIIVGLKEKTKYYGEKKRVTDTNRNNCAYQAIMGFKEIKVTQTTDYFIEEYDRAYEKQRDAEVKNEYIVNLPEKVIEAMCVTAMMGIICIKIAIGADMTNFTPKLAVFAVAAFRLLPSVSRMTRYMNGVIFNNAFLESAYRNLNEIDEYEKANKPADSNRAEISSETGALSFEKELQINDITWKYERSRKEILSHLSMSIKKGESVGLIGASGAGKTTLADIILGLLRPEQGEVLLDGIDVFTNPKGWSKVIGYVPQSIFLSDDTIRNNVAFGHAKETIKDEDVWAALREAQMEAFVKDLPEQLDTMVGERGIKFSGGQRQRIAIARTLYMKPEIIVLDEATSALDNDTEKAVMEAIDSLQGYKTLIIVAHRLSTIKNCDTIYEITKGRAVRKPKEEIVERKA